MKKYRNTSSTSIEMATKSWNNNIKPERKSKKNNQKKKKKETQRLAKAKNNTAWKSIENEIIIESLKASATLLTGEEKEEKYSRDRLRHRNQIIIEIINNIRNEIMKPSESENRRKWRKRKWRKIFIEERKRRKIKISIIEMKKIENRNEKKKKSEESHLINRASMAKATSKRRKYEIK